MAGASGDGDLPQHWAISAALDLSSDEEPLQPSAPAPFFLHNAAQPSLLAAAVEPSSSSSSSKRPWSLAVGGEGGGESQSAGLPTGALPLSHTRESLELDSSEDESSYDGNEKPEDSEDISVLDSAAQSEDISVLDCAASFVGRIEAQPTPARAVPRASAGPGSKKLRSRGDGRASDGGAVAVENEPQEWVYPGAFQQKSSPSKTNNLDPEAENSDNDEEAGADAKRMTLFRRSTLVAVGRDHPDSLCEPRAVRDTRPEPLEPDEELRVPMSLVNDGLLSSPQLESIALASRRFRQTLPGGARCGFLLGDGTGCGKGRCIAALILDQWNRGARRHVWISATSDLCADAMRDLTDLRTGLPVCSLPRVQRYGALDSLKGNSEVSKLGPNRDGVLFLTYSMLVSSRGGDAYDPDVSRFGQVISWLRFHEASGSGVICFDEAHKAKNLDEGTKCARMVDDLQRACPGCPVLYASATGATEVAHMQYMVRLGLWGDLAYSVQPQGTDATDTTKPCAFPDFPAFRSVVEKGGMPAMELVAIQLKSMGALSCRSLAFEGTSFDLVTAALSQQGRQQYDMAVDLWRDVFKAVDNLTEQGLTDSRTLMGQFWASQQRFFKGLLIAAKVPLAVAQVQKALADGEAVVISLWTTNESVLSRLRPAAESERAVDAEGQSDGFLSGPELTLEHFLNTVQERIEKAGNASLAWASASVSAFRARLKHLELPPNPLDDLIDRLGGPGKVAEMSGRSARRCRDPLTGEVRVEPRRRPQSDKRQKKADVSVDSVNIAENRLFQRGEKLVAIITEAASAGISLHSDRREERAGVARPRPRRMVCLELPWAADKAVQQLGRVHRSNQLFPPSFVCVVTDLGAEARFISAVTHRLRQLGAMTRGDRHAGLGTSDAFGFGSLDMMSSVYGPRALGKLLGDVVRQETEVPAPKGWRGGWKALAAEAHRELEAQDIVVNAREAEKKGGLKRFLNRLLGCTCAVQNGLFEALSAQMKRLEDIDRKEGALDEGVVCLNSNGKWGRLRQVEELRADPLGEAAHGLMLRRLRLDRGIPWEAIEEILASASHDEDNLQGYYLRPRDRGQGMPEPFLAIRRRGRIEGATATYTLYMPHTAPSNNLDGATCTMARFQNHPVRRQRATPEMHDEVQQAWRRQYELSATTCIHRIRGQNCKEGSLCQMGIRCVEQTMLTGPILAHWNTIVATPGVRGSLVRATIEEGRVLVGIMLGADSSAHLHDTFERRAAQEARASREAKQQTQQPFIEGFQLEGRQKRRQPEQLVEKLRRKKWDPIGVPDDDLAHPEQLELEFADESSDSFDEDDESRRVRIRAEPVDRPNWAMPSSSWATAAAATAPGKRQRVVQVDDEGSPIVVLDEPDLPQEVVNVVPWPARPPRPTAPANAIPWPTMPAAPVFPSFRRPVAPAAAAPVAASSLNVEDAASSSGTQLAAPAAASNGTALTVDPIIAIDSAVPAAATADSTSPADCTSSTPNAQQKAFQSAAQRMAAIKARMAAKRQPGGDSGDSTQAQTAVQSQSDDVSSSQATSKLGAVEAPPKYLNEKWYSR